MHKFVAVTTVLFGLICVSPASPAVAQVPHRSVYFAPVSASPAVSPYLNLGVSSNGLSNYQTQVRPLLKDREMLAQQLATAQRLRQQSRQPSDDRAASDPRGQASSDRNAARRFMNYSHYFSRPR